MKFLEMPVIKYLLIGLFSLVCSILLFMVGGSIAEVTGDTNTLTGFGYKLGGAMAGFFVIFWQVSRRVEKGEKLQLKKLITKIHLLNAPRQSSQNGQKYECTIALKDMVTGKAREDKTAYGWENGVMTLYPKPGIVGPDDYYWITVVHNGQAVWQSETNDVRAPKIHEATNSVAR